MNYIKILVSVLLVLFGAALITDAALAQGETFTLFAKFGPPDEADTWTKYSIPLTAETFGTDAKTFQYLLSNVTLFRIRTEMHDGSDTGGIDEVKIGTVYASDFNLGLEGWNAAGDGTLEWMATGGFDGGYLQVSDWAAGDFHYAVFPATWAGDWTPLIGQNIEFYLKTDHPSYETRVEISNQVTKRIILTTDGADMLPGGTKSLRIALVPPPTEKTVVNLTTSNNGCVQIPGDIQYPANADYQDVELYAPTTASNCQSVVEVASAGYTTSRLTVNVGNIDPLEFATLQGKVTDATNGVGIGGVVITIGDITTTTDETGAYLIENIPLSEGRADFYGTPRSGEAPLFVQFQDLSSVGYNFIEAFVEEYYPYSSSLILPGGETTVLDISLSPRVVPGGMRFVLNWGESPLDLDLYLKTPFIEGSQYVISWLADGSATSPPFAKLDHDDIDGLGPETITIYNFFTGTYHVFVDNFSGTPGFDVSRAQVQVYNSDGLLETITAPTEGDGAFWHVADIDGTTKLLTVINSYTDTEPGGGGLLTASFKEKPQRASIEALSKVMDIRSWAWDLNGDGIVDSNVKNPKYTYDSEGKYTVSLTVSDGHTFYTETKTDYITVFSTDVTPPGPVTELFADPVSPTEIDLTWVNPTDVDYLATVVMRRTDRFPQSVGDGSYVYNDTGNSFRDTGLEPETTYYYSAFAYDGRYNYSALGSTSTDSATTLALLKQGLKVNISRFDIGDFGTVKAYVSVVDSVTLEAVRGLSAENFMLYEDETMEFPLLVEEVGGTTDASVDIVFVFDVTGSMGSYINGLKDRAIAFADSLDSKGIDYRLGLVAYDDAVRSTWDFTSDAAQFKAWVSSLVASGGGDIAENALEGLANAASFGFRPDAQRMTILITDATYHELDKPGQGTTSYTTESMIDLLISKGIVNHVVGPNLAQMHALSEETGGLYFNIGEDFSAIIDLLGNIISNQYLVTYDTHNPAVDNTWRYVFVEVREGIKYGSDWDRYFIGEPIDNVGGFQAFAISSSQVVCRWVNPADTTFKLVVVTRSTIGYPTRPGDGTIVYSGNGSSFLDSGLSPNTLYYYSAFTYNLSGFYSDFTEFAADAVRTFGETEYTGGWATSRSGSSEDLLAVISTDSAHVYIAGKNGTFLKSTNAGASWSVQSIEKGAIFHDLLWLDNSGGGVVGENSASRATIWASDDAGATWEAFPPPSSAAINAIDGVDDTNIWGVSDGGGIATLQPAGMGWSLQESGVTNDLLCIDFVNSLSGWVGGTNGVILKTTNAGKSWFAQTSGTTADINGIHFQTEQLGWAVTSSGQILNTLNGGNTWNIMAVHSGPLNSVHFSDPLNGYAVGSAGALYGTTNGGSTWNAIKTYTSANLNDVYLLSPFLGWVVGDGGTILRLVREDDFGLYAGYRVNISSIDAEAFPTIKVFASVVDTSDNSSVTGLTKENFTLAEEAVKLSDFTVQEVTSSSGARADIAFVFDVTGSMGDEIAALKDRALRFADALASKGIDYRLGLVTFGDAVEEVHDFTTDVSEFKSWIGGLTATGGGDFKENSLEGLERSLLLSWRAVSQRIGILITDADYHQAGESGDGTTDQTTASMIDSLANNRIVLNTVGPDQPQFHQLSEETGGLWFDIGGDFSSIVDEISNIISSQYVITYTSPNTFTDNSWRQVDITAQRSDKAGHDRGRYFISGSRLAMDPTDVIGIKDDLFTVNIYVENVINLGFVHFIVNFDSSKLEVVDGALGDFLKQGGGSATTVEEIDNAKGKAELSLTRLASTGASGTGVLYTLKFHIKVENCTSNITMSSVNLRTADEPPKGIFVTVGGTSVIAAKALDGGALGDFVGDFDDDLDIDLRDFALLATYWKPANNPKGDIGPATGTVPTITPIPDGKVNFEDLFVFTRMWNWFNESRETLGGSLGKGFAGLEWHPAEVQPDGNTLRLELHATSVEQLAMGHLVVQYDQDALQYKSGRAGQFFTRGDASSAFMVEANSGRLEISMARLAQKGIEPAVSGSGAIAVLDFERKGSSADLNVRILEADLRSLDNSAISVSNLAEFAGTGLGVPNDFALSQNYPNPFNNRTRIQFSLPSANRVTITVLNLLGQPVRTLVNTDMAAGTHQITWDGRNDYGQEVAGGIYLVRMEAGSFRDTHEMLFLK